MNVLLVRPKPDKKTINLQSFMICEPLELEYLAAYLQESGHAVNIVDLILEDKPLSTFLEQFRPQLVGFTAYLPHVGIVKALAAEAKAFDPGIITVVGGIHAEVCPQDLVDACIDHVAAANGMELIAALADGRLLPTTSEKQTTFDYPYPDRGLTARYRHRYSYIFHERCATIKTSFGCPYNCAFCFCARITDGRYFCRELDSVIAEMQQIEEQNVFIVDDNFLFNQERVEAFCHLMAEHGIRKRFILFGRADFIAEHPDTMRLLRQTGLDAVFVGVESFRQDELEAYDKRTTVEVNRAAAAVLEENGILFYCGLMVSNDWSRQDFDGLIEYMRSFSYPFVNIQPVTPMPGTPFYESVKEQMATARKRPELWDMAHLLLPPTKMSEREFYRNIVRAYRKISLRPRMHLFVLRRFGLKVYLRTFQGVIAIYKQYRELMAKGCLFT